MKSTTSRSHLVRWASIGSPRAGVARANIGALEVFDGALECTDVSKGPHTRRYSLYASWIYDFGVLVILLGSLDSYSYLYQKDHINTNIYVYKKVRKGLDSKYDVLNENASL